MVQTRDTDAYKPRIKPRAITLYDRHPTVQRKQNNLKKHQIVERKRARAVSPDVPRRNKDDFTLTPEDDERLFDEHESDESLSSDDEKDMRTVRDNSLSHRGLDGEYWHVPPEFPKLRKRRKSSKPRNYGSSGINATSSNAETIITPSSYKEAMNSPESKHWLCAMQEEYDSLMERKVWRRVPRPKKTNVVGSRWVFRVKNNPDGTQKFKARLVAKGYSQKFGADYTETFAPVIRAETLRWLFSHAIQNDLKIHLVDVITAYLYGEMDHVVFMEPPEGFEGDDELICLLLQALYGTKQGGRRWHKKLIEFLFTIGFIRSSADPCLFIKKVGEFLMGIYVDDLFFFGTDDAITIVKRDFTAHFEVHDLGVIKFGLGVEYERVQGGMLLHQSKYITEMMAKYLPAGIKAPVRTPMIPGIKILATTGNQRLTKEPYRALIGSLLYAAGMTRPDIALAVGICSRHMAKPNDDHWDHLLRILKYLISTSDYGLFYQKSKKAYVHGFCDAAYQSDPDTGHSQMGYLFFHGRNLVAWKSWKYRGTLWSSTEAEYVALAEAAREAVWVRSLVTELGIQTGVVVLYEDNNGALALAHNPEFHERSKHIAKMHHYVREVVDQQIVQVLSCRTRHMLADTMTKPQHRPLFEEHRWYLNIRSLRQLQK